MPRQAQPQPRGPAQPRVPAAALPAAVEEQVFRLYVSAVSPVSSRAIANARRFCEHHFPGAHRLLVLDIAANVEAARRDQIVASPTLLRVSPLPHRRLIGDMSDTARLTAALGLAHTSAD